MEFHPVSNLFPPLGAGDLAALAADIQAQGLHNPIWTYHGQIVDGRARYTACQMAGVAPRYQEWDDPDSATLPAFVVSQNLQRRHLTTGQRAVLALTLERECVVAAQERQASDHYNAPQYAGESVPAKIPELVKGEAHAQAGQ